MSETVAANGTATLTVARTVEELRELAEPWRRLQGSHFATDPDVFPEILAAQPHALRPHVLLLRRDGEARAVVVGRLEEIPLSVSVGYKVLFSPRVRALTVVYRGVLGDLSETDARAVVEALRGALATEEADVVRFRNLVVGSPLYTVATTTRPRLLRENLERPFSHWQLTLPGSYAAFLSSLSRKTRDGFGRYSRKLEKDFGDRLDLKRYTDLADADRVFTDLRRVAEKTYQQGLGVSFAQSELQRRIALMQMERGWFRAYVLYLDGEPVSFWQGYAYGGVFSTGVPGYDPAYARQRVGNYVLLKLIEDLCEDETIHTLDFGFGDAEYKRRFGSTSWLEQDVHIFAGTAKGIRTALVRRTSLGLTDLVRRSLERTEAVDRVKKAWRDRLARNRPS